MKFKWAKSAKNWQDQTGGSEQFQRVGSAIEEMRTRLLDLSMMNRLLNYKPSDRSKQHIRIVDEVPRVLVDKLQGKSKLIFEPVPMPEIEPEDEQTETFQARLKDAKRSDEWYLKAKASLGARPRRRETAALERELRDRLRAEFGFEPWRPTKNVKEHAESLGISISFDLPLEPGQDASRHTDDKLQVLHFPDDMEAKLEAIWSASNSLEKDAGIQALYAGFGFLEWYQSRDSSEKVHAPLLLFPVRIFKEMQDRHYEYAISGRDEDEAINISLQEKLKADFGLVLPDVEEFEDEGKIDLNGWFAEIDKAVKKKDPRWTVKSWVTVGLMTFHKIAIWEDLDPTKWPNGADPRQSPILSDIFSGGEPWDGTPAGDHDIDQVEKQEDAPLLITDADSSQHSAVLDVVAGKSLVIEGPPGTGKSQTITNIIAAALNKGQSILFVSEKMAALDVVKSRLDAANLGEFCLELHSDKASRAAVLGSLKRRFEMATPPRREGEIANLRKVLEKRRADLTGYVEKMNAPVGETGWTVHDVLWGHARTQSILERGPLGLKKVRLKGALSLSRFEVEEMKRLAASLCDAAAPFGELAKPSTQPWRGIGRHDVTAFEVEEIVAALAGAIDAAFTAQQAIMEAAALTGTASTLIDLCDWYELSDALPEGAAALRTELVPAIAALHADGGCARARALATIIEARDSARVAAERPAGGLIAQGSAAIAAVARTVEAHGLETMTADEIGATRARLRGFLGRLDAGVAGLRRLAPLLSTEKHLQPEGVLLLLAALKVKVPQAEARALMCEDLKRDGVAAALEKAKAAAALLRADFAEIGEDVHEKAVPGARAAKDAAAAIRNAGFWRRLFSGTYKDAVRQCRGMFPSRRKMKRPEMVAALEAAAGWREHQMAFMETMTASPLLKQLVPGPGAPFTALIEAARWCEAVRKAVPATFDGAVELRRAVLGADEEAHGLLQAFVAEHGGVLEGVAASGGDSFAAAKANTEEKLTGLDIVLGFLKGVIWPKEAPVGGFGAAANLVADVEAAEAALAQEESWARSLGSLYENSLTAPSLLRDAADAVEAVKSWPLSPDAMRSLLLSGDADRRTADLIGKFKAADLKAKEAVEAMEAFEAKLAIDWEIWCPNSQGSAPEDDEVTCEDVDLGEVITRGRRALERADLLLRQSALTGLEKQAASSEVGGIAKAWVDADLGYSGLEAAVDAVFLRSLAEDVVKSDPGLSTHLGSAHESLRRSFQELDRKWLELNRQELRARLARSQVPSGSRSGPRGGWTDLELIVHQCSLERPSMHLRKLFTQAGDAIRALTPVVMMSPMSVARYLAAGRHFFDLVVIDEASQMRPEDAAGALLRCRQAVVVGDPKQLAPSSFFVHQGSDGTQADGADGGPEIVEESLLELAMRAWKPVRTLRWHYRSRHQSLIAFSNSEFYAGRLIVFPSDRDRGPTSGVHLEKVDGVYGDSLNEIEAKAVAESARKFMVEHPTKSLGIVAMNQPQKELISSLMDRIYVEDPAAESYRRFWSDKLESVFVKNLENVQGDERDGILISTVYGKDAKGAFPMRFGPVNSATGHRRLNVLFTRAKEMMTIFTSMDPDEIVPAPGSHHGVKVLKAYLDYARTGYIPAATEEELLREGDNEFEQWFLDRLTQAGYEAVPQVGVRGYRIDVGVRHPDLPGRFILGIECDGATYHSSKVARDRDRLRQTVLERLGWTIHRVWSTDWFRDPEGEFQALIRKIEVMRSAGRPA
jgi:hypothetical protein